MKKILQSKALHSFIASMICVILGMVTGYLVLLLINPNGAWKAISTVIENFFTYSKSTSQLKYFGETLVKMAPLLMCALSVLFSYKVGLFNIGAAGQYVIGSCACIYAGLAWGWHWLPCMLFALAAGAVFGLIVGLLKAYCNVNEVISGIMLNWIGLYLTNMILTTVKESTSPYTYQMAGKGKKALLPTMGLDKLFGDKYVTIAIPLAILIAILIWILLEKTRFGYELRATGYNKFAAKYCGMAQNRNIIISLVISGALAGLGGSFFYQTGIQQWECTVSAVPGMGFNGIAATFLGGLNPIGTIFASYFIQHITSGGAYVDKTMYCAQISDLIAAFIIYLCGFVLFLKTIMNKMLNKAFDKKQKTAVSEANKDGGDKK